MLKWRLVNPQILLGVGYASEAALGLLHNKANDFLARKAAASPAAEPAPPMSPRARAGGPPPGGGLSTGLDDAFNEVDPPEDPRMENLMKMAREAKRGPGPEAKDAPQKKKKKFGDQLLARAQEREERGREKDRSKEKAKRSRTRSGGRRSKSHRDEDVDDEYSGSSHDGESSGDVPVFREASHREVDLVRLSQRNPGCLLRSALREMNRYMAARGEAMSEEQAPNRVLSYLHQILLPQYPKAGLRSQRELVTLATALDSLLDGNLGGAGDVLAQRFKALESSLASEGSWQVARHHELIPSQATLATRAELSEAAKAEARALRLKKQMLKNANK